MAVDVTIGAAIWLEYGGPFIGLNEIPAGPALVAAAPQDEIRVKVTEARVVNNGLGYELAISNLLKKHTCSACHAKDSKLIGPAFTEIAKRSRDDFSSWALRLTTLLEPLLILIMGLIVGGVVVVMMLSITSVADISV